MPSEQLRTMLATTATTAPENAPRRHETRVCDREKRFVTILFHFIFSNDFKQILARALESGTGEPYK